MAGRFDRITAPELEHFIIADVQLTGVTLGSGAYGSVQEVNTPFTTAAAKILHPHLINLDSSQKVHKWVSDFVEECKLMSQLRHPHIVQFLGVAYLPESPIPVLLMEKLQDTLHSHLETSPVIPLNVKVHLLTGIAKGVVYLHSRTPPIAHRDLTARNILIDSGLTAKIADLGVARMVNIQPGQLAATMTACPGNSLYMPSETVQEEGTTRYNTAIDIFSFGVVSLFTLTQTFPKDLKPATFFDEGTQKIVGRSEIERREYYIQLMQTALVETHILVKLTLDCLEYSPKDRPSAVGVLRQLECQTQLNEKNAQISNLQSELVAEKAEKEEQLQGLQELTVLQQQQLEVQRREIENLSGQLRSLELQSQEDGVNQIQLYINFNWKKRKDLPQDSRTYGQPIAFNSKLYVRAYTATQKGIVLEFTPSRDQWTELPPPPVEDFTIATLRGQLLVVGGRDKTTCKTTNTILTFDEISLQWVQSYPAMPTAVTRPAVIGYQNHLIVAGDTHKWTADVYILNTTTNEWKMSEQLPYAGYYRTLLIENTIYLTFQFIYENEQSTMDQKPILRAHVPTLISGTPSGVWEVVTNSQYSHSSLITIGNTLLTVGGSNEQFTDSNTDSINLYDHTTNKWTKIGRLPEPISACHCVSLFGELFVLGGHRNSSVYSVKPYITTAL